MAKKKIIDLFNLVSQEIDSDISHYQFTITGAFGSGKSTFANALFNEVGNAVTFGAEDRFKGIKDIKVVPITNWYEALEYKKVLKKGVRDNGGESPFEFNTIILDPVGRLAKMCETYICEENGWESLADGGYGKGYSLFEEEFNGFVEELKIMGFKIVNIAHGRSDTITPPRATEGYQVFVPDVPKKLRYVVQGEADFVLYLDVLRQVDEDTGINKPVRRLYLQNYADYELKVPLDGLPDYIEYETVDEGVAKFIEVFNKAVEITKNKPSKQKPKQEQKIKKSATVKVDENPTIETVIPNAVIVRDELLKTLDRDKVVEILTDSLGTAIISDCTDIDKLIKFVREYETF